MSTRPESATELLVAFSINDQSYGIPLHRVKRVIHAVEVRHLPEAPEKISGIINVKGQIIPVISFRGILGLNEREPALTDRIIIAETSRRVIAFLADSVDGITEIPENRFTESFNDPSYTMLLKGIGRTDDGMLLIYDLEEFLSNEEELALETSLKGISG